MEVDWQKAYRFACQQRDEAMRAFQNSQVDLFLAMERIKELEKVDNLDTV